MVDFDMEPIPSPKFSCGFDLASLAVASDVVYSSWLNLSEFQNSLLRESSSESVEFKQFELGKFNVVAFVSSVTPQFLQDNGDLVSSEEIPDFQFLCSKVNPKFFINGAVISLFRSVQNQLSVLKSEIAAYAKSKDAKPFIITGYGMGGSVAALFTLWLLDSHDPLNAKWPLCITFGSPLIGNQGFQEAVSQYRTWNSCFMHVVHKDDSFPNSFNPKHYAPFGIYLFCSDSGSACFESTGSVTELLAQMRRDNHGNRVSNGFDYGSVINCLRGKKICRDPAKPNRGRDEDSFLMGIKAQLAAIGFQQQMDINYKIEEAEKDALIYKMGTYDAAKKLNDMKVNMAKLGWYKKETAKDEVGYYDSYKTMGALRDKEAELPKKKLDNYWKKTVEDAEKQPQKVEAILRKRWAYSGTIYRRMVEPLHIANFYKVKGNRNYIRPKYLLKLEEMLKDSEKPESSDLAERRHIMIGSKMTEDSCFWAHVEEAILSCESLQKISTDHEKKAVEDFEEYAYNQIENYRVSPEIFLRESTYMKWWKLYQLILKDDLMGPDHDSKLIRFMTELWYRKDNDGIYTPRE